MSRQFFRFVVTIILFLGLLPSIADAEKTDVVILINGNAVTGEVKSLEFGSLRYSTDSMGTVNIDWEDIVSVSSNQSLQIELSDGTRYFGQLLPTGDKYVVRIATATQELTIEANRIVRITPIETSERFLDRLDGSFTLGAQTQKSSQVTTSNLAADVSYRARAYLLGLRLSSAVTDDAKADVPTSAHQSFGFNYQRFRKNRWFTDWFTSWERNDEQGIAARVSAGGAFGRYLTQTNKSQLSLAVGAQAARSAFTGEDDSTTEAEGRIELRYLRRNLTPEASLRFTSTVYPLLDDFSTFRAESDLSWRREVFEDLFLELRFNYSYLSDPPTGGENDDYSATTSIGYSF